jgi:hypothetical protein
MVNAWHVDVTTELLSNLLLSYGRGITWPGLLQHHNLQELDKWPVNLCH